MCVDCYVSCKWLRVIWFSTSTFPVLLSPPIGGIDLSGDATAAKGTTPNQCVILQSVYWYCIYSFTMAIQYTLYTTSTKRPYKRQAHFISAFLWYVRLSSLIFQGRARFPWQLYLYYPAPAIVFNISLFSALIFWFGWRCPRQSAADRLMTESADFFLFYIVRCYPVATFCAGALIVFYCYCCRIGETKTKTPR